MTTNYIMFEPWPTAISPVGLFHKHTVIPFLLWARQAVTVILEPLVVWPVPSYHHQGATWLLLTTFQRDVNSCEIIKSIIKKHHFNSYVNATPTTTYDAYRAQRGWLALFYVVASVASWSLPRLILPPNGERRAFQTNCQQESLGWRYVLFKDHSSCCHHTFFYLLCGLWPQSKY